MTNKQMVAALKRMKKIFSASQIASDLGYRSPTTVLNWLTQGQIPVTAIARVAKYLKSKEGIV